MRRLSILIVTLLIAAPVHAQMTYAERAALSSTQEWQQRVGIAVQQHAVVVSGEDPKLCCQISTHEALIFRAGKQTLCDLTFPSGKPGAPAYILNASVQRHVARANLARMVLESSLAWATRMAAIIASDQCVTSSAFTDVQIQAYMVRLWDLYALSPELAATPVEGAPVIAPSSPPVAPPQVVPPVPPLIRKPGELP